MIYIINTCYSVSFIDCVNVIYSSRREISEEEEEDTHRRSPERYDDDDDREGYDEYDNQSTRKQRVEVSLQMPQLSIPYSDDNKVNQSKTCINLY